ncbi:MAG: hypothetical protein AAF721_26315 [Myxococcota bacterium]
MSDEPSAGTHVPVPRTQPGKGWPLDYEGEFNVPALAVGLAALLISKAVWEWHTSGHTQVPWDLSVGFSLVIGVPALFALWEQYQDIRFRNWILASWADIVAGRAKLDGVPVDPETRLVQYRVVFSGLLVHTEFCSGPVLPGTAAARRSRWISTAVTALAGWWSLPGIVRTPIAVTQNIRDKGFEIRLADVANATLYGKPLHELEIDDNG